MATRAARTSRAGNTGLGVLAIFLDMLKAAAPVALAHYVFGVTGWGLTPVVLAPILGHAFSPFLGFRGGKALACTFGAWTALTVPFGPFVMGGSVFVFHKLLTVSGWAVMASLLTLLVFPAHRRRDAPAAGRVGRHGADSGLDAPRGSAAAPGAAAAGASVVWPMRPLWLYVEISAVAFVACLVLIALSNWRLLRRIDRYPPPPRTPRVSVLVPARNEEAHIGDCVRSLLAQDYPDFEVVVLNDHSTDRTGAILADLSAGDERLRVLTGRDLPAGWLGKHWACQQLSEAAGGELLLFTDADTRHGSQIDPARRRGPAGGERRPADRLPARGDRHLGREAGRAGRPMEHVHLLAAGCGVSDLVSGILGDHRPIHAVSCERLCADRGPRGGAQRCRGRHRPRPAHQGAGFALASGRRDARRPLPDVSECGPGLRGVLEEPLCGLWLSAAAVSL